MFEFKVTKLRAIMAKAGDIFSENDKVVLNEHGQICDWVPFANSFIIRCKRCCAIQVMAEVPSADGIHSWIEPLQCWNCRISDSTWTHVCGSFLMSSYR